jgi:hypothetical protein
MRICIRTRAMRLMSDRAYAYAYGRLYIYRLLALEIERISQVNQQVKEASKVTTVLHVYIELTAIEWGL